MKKKVISGLIGIAALMLTTTAFANCKSATVNAVGNGTINDIAAPALSYTLRWADVTCNDKGSTESGRIYFHSVTDPDGKMEMALTALSQERSVSYNLYYNTKYAVEFSVNN